MRMPLVLRILSPCVLLLWSAAGIARSAESAAAQPAARADWPREVIVTIGDVRTRIDGPKLWTLSGIDYQDTIVAVQDSAYGTVLTIRDLGHLGTAHFLDVPGKPGEVEKEDVISLRLFVDDTPVSEFTPKMHLRGNSFRAERTSKIRGMDLRSTIGVREGVLVETAHLRATQPMDLQKAHPLMYAWTPEAMVYVFGDDNGIQNRGNFLKEGATHFETFAKVRWVAVFNPASGKGSVCYLVKHPLGDDTVFLLIDAPGIYRKVAIMCLVDTVVPEGFAATYQVALGFFSATEGDWEQRAMKCVTELKALDVPPDDQARVLLP
jgi:hypothetical protein